MAGNFKDSRLGDRILRKGSPEFNLMIDVPAAQKVFSSWPTPIVDSGFEIGLGPYPGRSISRDFAYVKNQPIADTYKIYCEEMKSRDSTIKVCPDDHNHFTFDLTSVLYAARPDENYFSLSPSGIITVLSDGSTRFSESERGAHRYLILSDSQRTRTLEAMMMLASQPPHGP
jgi:purine nucleosidase